MECDELAAALSRFRRVASTKAAAACSADDGTEARHNGHTTLGASVAPVLHAAPAKETAAAAPNGADSQAHSETTAAVPTAAVPAENGHPPARAADSAPAASGDAGCVSAGAPSPGKWVPPSVKRRMQEEAAAGSEARAHAPEAGEPRVENGRSGPSDTAAADSSTPAVASTAPATPAGGGSSGKWVPPSVKRRMEEAAATARAEASEALAPGGSTASAGAKPGKWVPPSLRRLKEEEQQHADVTSASVSQGETTESVDGLADWLSALGLLQQFDGCNRWCEENGASFLEEVAENAEDLGQALGLGPNQMQQLVTGGRRALAVVLRKHSMHGDTPAHKHTPLRSLSTLPGSDGSNDRFQAPLRSQPSASEEEATPKHGSHWLTVQAAFVRCKRTIRKQHSDELPHHNDGHVTPKRMTTVDFGGPLAPIWNCHPVKEGQLLFKEVQKREKRTNSTTKALLPRAPGGHIPMGRMSTIGFEEPPQRDRLKDQISHANKKVEIDEGQTGQVYAIESGGQKIAVFKPVAGEKFHRKGLDAGKGYLREEGVYLVDRLCGSQAGVPVSSRASFGIEGEAKVDGCVQEFVPDVVGSSEDFGMPRDLTEACQMVTLRDAEALALLDMRVFNMDRHPGNLLFKRHDKPHGLGPIDHGCCLPPWWTLSEAVFDAWHDWPQLKCQPSSFAKDVARESFMRLEEVCKRLRALGLDTPCILTLQLCTLFVFVGVAELGLPIRKLSDLMLRDFDTDLQEFSWLEARVFECAKASEARCRQQVSDRGDKELVVENEGQELQEQKFLECLEEVFRRELALLQEPADDADRAPSPPPTRGSSRRW